MVWMVNQPSTTEAKDADIQRIDRAGLVENDEEGGKRDGEGADSHRKDDGSRRVAVQRMVAQIGAGQKGQAVRDQGQVQGEEGDRAELWGDHRMQPECCRQDDECGDRGYVEGAVASACGRGDGRRAHGWPVSWLPPWADLARRHSRSSVSRKAERSRGEKAAL